MPSPGAKRAANAAAKAPPEGRPGPVSTALATRQRQGGGTRVLIPSPIIAPKKSQQNCTEPTKGKGFLGWFLYMLVHVCQLAHSRGEPTKWGVFHSKLNILEGNLYLIY